MKPPEWARAGIHAVVPMLRIAIGLMLIASCFPIRTPAPISHLDGEEASGVPAAAATPGAAGAVAGSVRTPDGKPAAAVRVRLFQVATLASESVAADSSGPAEVRTGPDGRFEFESPPEGEANLEAVQSEDFKVFKQAIEVRKSRPNDVGNLNLARTGSITGRVVAPEAPTVTDFLGVDVYIPGSSYVAKTDRAGRFTLANVAPGTFAIVAASTGLGTAEVSNVTVRPEGQADSPDLQLSLKAPRILSIEPGAAGPGTTVKISGENFGASKGATLQVVFNGTPASATVRSDDRSLAVVVPTGATSGNVVATVGGIPSNGIAFKVISRLVLAPEDPALLVGQAATMSASGEDSMGLAVSDPRVTWSVEGAAVRLEGTIMTALAPGTASVVARSGDVSGSTQVRVLGGQVRKTEIRPGAVRLGQLADATAAVASITELTDGATLSYAILQSSDPASVSIDASGKLTVHDLRSNGWITLTATSRLDSTSVGTASIRLSNAAFVETIAGAGSSGLADGVGSEARFSYPQGLAADRWGNLLVADTVNHRIRRVAADRSVTTVAGSGGTGLKGGGYRDGSSADALIYWPLSLAIDAGGSLFLTDGTGEGRVRKVDPGGTVSTVLAGGRFWSGIAVVPDGGLVLTDIAGVYVSPPGGTLTRIAGSDVNLGSGDGPGSSARFNGARNFAIDPEGNVYLPDTQNASIRKVTPQGITGTIAGTRVSAHKDGPLDLAQFFNPYAAAYGPDGTIYVADQGDGRIRYITPGGLVGTLAGAGGSAVVNGPGAEAYFGQPEAMTLSPSGDLFVSDSLCHCIRRVRF